MDIFELSFRRINTLQRVIKKYNSDLYSYESAIKTQVLVYLNTELVNFRNIPISNNLKNIIDLTANQIIMSGKDVKKRLIDLHRSTDIHFRQHTILPNGTLLISQIICDEVYIDNQVSDLIENDYKNPDNTLILSQNKVILLVGDPKPRNYVIHVDKSDITHISFVGNESIINLIEYPNIIDLTLENTNQQVSSSSVNFLQCKNTDPKGHRIPNLNTLVVTNKSLSTGHLYYPKLDTLYFLDTTINNLEDMGELNLSTLKFIKCTFRHIDARPFELLSALQYLEFRFCNLTNLPIDIFSGLTNLKSLDLKSNNLTEVDYLEGLNNLMHLNMDSNYISKPILFPKLKSLKMLSIYGNYPMIDRTDIVGIINTTVINL